MNFRRPPMGQGPGGPASPEMDQIRRTAEWAAQEARRAAEQAQASGSNIDQAVAQVRREHELVMQNLTDLSNVLASLQTNRIGGGSGNPDVQRIEDIPGRRVPFDLLTEINIAANDTSIRTGTSTISQTGPFVAVARYCAFLSQYTFSFRDPETGDTLPTFLGRSNGRFRPIHSAGDVMDAILPADVQRIVAFPGTGDASYSSPALHAPYRTMEFDARIEIKEQGSGYPRSNIPVPSPFWTTFINSPFPLGALDFYARAEVIQYSVQPQHVNNPRSGNLFGFTAGGIFPFSDAQFDHHEGINDPENPAVGEDDPDPVTRIPTGVLIIGQHGYRIIQPPGAVTQAGSV